ncbi:hypothetical protein I302_100771 [Kwoniella bestiolae CBS 10118]|uniref:Uncharacterized protein n=1 Tax=Kwoniella bestiolae CBS 10118 TaxID=1296100 RepID=A0A1B9G604_9TREE|nr:hypothetical protein I302_04144 [Kwoniella bestiolae CBS 10118]OCF26459.1 hypothetical protein I302_04144 [Kwoniella bestiolae CBS 10118]
MSSSSNTSSPSSSLSSTNLTKPPSPTKESLQPLNGLIHHIPHTTSFITSSIEDTTNNQSTIEVSLKLQALARIPRMEMIEAEIRSNEEYDDTTKMEFAEAFKEMERMVRDQERQEREHSGEVEVEVLVFRKVLYDSLYHDLATPQVESIIRAWTFGRIEIDFTDGQVQVIIRTDRGPLILHQKILEGIEGDTEESTKDELIFWFIKFLGNLQSHPVCPMRIMVPTKEPKFDINPIISTCRNAIQVEKRNLQGFKRKFDEMMECEIILHVLTEEEEKANNKMEERWRKINEWMKRHEVERKEKAQKRLQSARKDLFDRLEIEKENGKKRQRIGQMGKDSGGPGKKKSIGKSGLSIVNPPQNESPVDEAEESTAGPMENLEIPGSEDLVPT